VPYNFFFNVATQLIVHTRQFAATHGVKAPGSRGHFKTSSVITLSILRQHTDTLLAMLEAFALDPLLTWQAKEVENPAGEYLFAYNLKSLTLLNMRVS
jgi:phosphatidylinositol kinase/protein kinase (PI-3  family)